MEARSKKTTGAGLERDIEITFVHLDGKRSRVSLSSRSSIQVLFTMAYERRTQYKGASLESYQRAINLSHQSGKLTSLRSTLAESNITSGSIIYESLKKWVRGINVVQDTLSITDPVTLEEINGKPYLLYPGCRHALERNSIKQWVEQCVRTHQRPTCPCCRATIAEEHISKLVPERDANDEDLIDLSEVMSPAPAPGQAAGIDSRDIPLSLAIPLSLFAIGGAMAVDAWDGMHRLQQRFSHGLFARPPSPGLDDEDSEEAQSSQQTPWLGRA